MSHCHDINCFELVTVTASSEAVAEELFSKFEKGTIQPKLSIPKWVANIFDKFLEDDYDWYDFEMAFVGCDNEELERNFFAWTNTEKAKELTLAYLNPLTRIFVEIEG
ncbi:hypothetical protein N568_0101255 [Lactococcus garvieae TRF1]|uniref:Uncharacterized protein n=1 Tax=Lactococcus garvieae TRF1 TaxID=1380772 RepID=V8ASZ9_9LACT|nr:hypothetical protein N568_0101255 [Lactococcus garvieae TRF1]